MKTIASVNNNGKIILLEDGTAILFPENREILAREIMELENDGKISWSSKQARKELFKTITPPQEIFNLLYAGEEELDITEKLEDLELMEDLEEEKPDPHMEAKAEAEARGFVYGIAILVAIIFLSSLVAYPSVVKLVQANKSSGITRNISNTPGR